MITHDILLLDGPLTASGPSKRQRLVSDMARDLIRFDAYRVEADAVLSLFACRRYPTFWIFACFDDALGMAWMEAQLAAVAEAMSDQ